MGKIIRNYIVLVLFIAALIFALQNIPGTGF